MSSRALDQSLPDQTAREQISHDLERSYFVEASAGTGKTTCMINRMVNLLRTGVCKIETLAAVTFTRKAAAELRIRFQAALELEQASSVGREKQRLEAALKHIENCFVGTIHAFCARLLRERPVEAGLDPSFVELDEQNDFLLRKQAWQQYVAELISTDAPILPELAQLGLKVTQSTRRSYKTLDELDEVGLEAGDLGFAFLKFCQFSDVADWPAEKTTLPDLQPLVKALQEYVQHVRSLEFVIGKQDKLAAKLTLLKRMIHHIDLQRPYDLLNVLEIFRELKITDVTQKNWPEKTAKEELIRFNNFFHQHVEVALRLLREHRYEPVLRAIRGAMPVYDRLRQEQNVLSFQDLLMRAAKLLRDSSAARNYFQQRFTHLLIDEFQDTDPIQAEVMLLLTAKNATEPNWESCVPRTGSLFVVGDPKQSIYRFRRADVVTYAKMRDRIESSGGVVLPLSSNFRSIPSVIKWLNTAFEQILPLRATSSQAAHSALHSPDNSRSNSTEQPVKALRIEGNKYQLSSNCAAAVAKLIHQLIKSKTVVENTVTSSRSSPTAQPGDFLILARRDKELRLYADCLQQYQIPHIVTGDDATKDVDELRLLRLALGSILVPDDEIALVAVLRSELFGVADSTLYHWRSRAGHFHFRKPPEGEGSQFEEIRAACQKLQHYATWLGAMPTVAAVERIAADLGLIARACAAQAGDLRSGGLLKAIELLRENRDMPPIECLPLLDSILTSELGLNGVSVLAPPKSAVRIMNVHQAKGLEAPFVFLVDPTGKKDYTIDVFVDRAEKPRGYLSIYGAPRSQHQPSMLLAQPQNWDYFEQTERQFQIDEELRLLYVAATRAGQQLVVSFHEKESASNPWERFSSCIADDVIVPTTSFPTQKAANVTFSLNDWQQAVQQQTSRRRDILLKSYDSAAVKESTLHDTYKPHAKEEQGAEWGNVLHSLLEKLIKKDTHDLSNLARTLLHAEGLSVDLVPQVIATVSAVRKSAVWHRAQQASRLWTEVPITWLSHSRSADGSELPTINRGVIDLMFQEKSSWIIVDYKTERVSSSEHSALAKYYRPQLIAYRDAWIHLTEETVASTGILFTHTGDYYSIT